MSVHLLRFLWSAVRSSDAVHVHTGRDLVSLTTLIVAWLRRVPVIAQTHGQVQVRRHLRSRLFDPLFLRLLRRTFVVLFMTESERLDLVDQLGVNARLRFQGNGVRLPERIAAPQQHQRPIVLFMARLHPVKRVDAFAQMAAVLVKRGVQADFVVHGPDQGSLDELQDIIEREGLHDVLRYAGALDHEAALEALSAASVFVLPSSTDWMPMSLLEALAAGVPCVCTTSVGISAQLSEAGAANVVNGSPVELADAVQNIIDDPHEQRRLRLAGRRIVADRYSIEAVVDQLVPVYAEASRVRRTSSTMRSRL